MADNSAFKVGKLVDDTKKKLFVDSEQPGAAAEKAMRNWGLEVVTRHPSAEHPLGDGSDPSNPEKGATANVSPLAFPYCVFQPITAADFEYTFLMSAGPAPGTCAWIAISTDDDNEDNDRMLAVDGTHNQVRGHTTLSIHTYLNEWRKLCTLAELHFPNR
jgi:hypothetical protein